MERQDIDSTHYRRHVNAILHGRARRIDRLSPKNSADGAVLPRQVDQQHIPSQEL